MTINFKIRPAVAEDFCIEKVVNDKGPTALQKVYYYGMYFLLQNEDESFSWHQFKEGKEAARSFARYFKAGIVYVPETGMDGRAAAVQMEEELINK